MDDEQTVTVHKANIHKQLRVNTCSIPFMQPCEREFWRRKKNVSGNTGFPPWHLTRYDAIFVLVDVPDKLSDEEKLNHNLQYVDQAVTEMDLRDSNNNQKKLLFTEKDIKTYNRLLVLQGQNTLNVMG